MADQVNASGGTPGSAGSVPPVANSGGETTSGVDYEKQYKELEPKMGEMGRELGQYREFIQEITPLLTELDANPDLVQAILDKKIDANFAKAALQGKLSVAEATAATEAHKEVKDNLGEAYGASSPDDIARLVEASFDAKMREMQDKNDFDSFERKTSEFIKNTPDFSEYADSIDEWIDAHPDIVDVEVAYYAVKGKLSEAAATKAAEEAQAEAAKQMMLNAPGGGVQATHVTNNSELVDSLIAGRTSPNLF